MLVETTRVTEFEYYFACTRNCVHLYSVTSPGKMIFAVSVELPKKSPVKTIKKVREVYISPYCRPVLVPPIFMKLGIRGQLTDVITCVKFLVDRFRGYGVLTPQNCHFPLICCVALTSV